MSDTSPYEIAAPRTVDEIKSAAQALGYRAKDLVVLATPNDPFYADTPAKQRDGEWFAGLWHRFGYTSGVHARRVHYRIVVHAAGEVTLPSGEVYANMDEHWSTLVKASAIARDLGLVDASLFVDRRNQPIQLYAPRREDQTPQWEVLRDGEALSEQQSPWQLPEPEIWVQPWFRGAQLPSLQIDTTPNINATDLGRVVVDGYDYADGDQPYYEALWIEKSTMDDILDPLCRELGVDYSANVGFASKTRAVELLRRARLLGKPMRVFVISDYDPAGSHMAPAIARNIEFYRDTFAPDVEVVVHHIGMTSDWVDKYDLPRAPIKEEDRRKASFEALHGEGCVELDALEALHPGALGDEVRSIIARYRDPDLRTKLSRARGDATRDANAAWRAITANVRAEVDSVRADAKDIAERYQEQLIAD